MTKKKNTPYFIEPKKKKKKNVDFYANALDKSSFQVLSFMQPCSLL